MAKNNMELLEVLEQEKDSYNRFVAEQPSGSFLQSWEWGEWQEKLGRKVYRLNVIDNSGLNIGTAQFIRMQLPFNKYYLYAPYGPVFYNNFHFFIMNLIRKFPDAVFLRIEAKNYEPNAVDQKTLNIQPGKTLLVDLAESEEDLLKQMHPKTRYNIKVAQKHGVEIKEEFGISIGNGIFFQEAVDLIYQTSKRQGFVSYPAGYYKGLMDFFVLNKQSQVKAHLYKAIFQNQLLASALMLDFGNTRTFLFGGSSEFHKNVMAPYLLHWKAMSDAKSLGLKFYDFWGIETSSGETPGFVRFKLGFGGQTKEYTGAYDAVIRWRWYRLYSLFRSLNKLLKKISR